MKKEKMSEGVQERLDALRICEQDLSALESKIQSSLEKQTQLQSEIDELEQLRTASTDDRKAIVDQFASGEIDETKVTEVRRRYAELADKLDQKVELKDAVNRALTDAQGQLNDAKTRLGNARHNVVREYRKQLQQEIRDQCGDKLLHAWAAWLGSGGHTGINGLGFFANELLLVDDADDGLRSPNYEEINQVRSEVCSTLGIDAE
jgi:predicted nuclease with TOPRIM domain